MGFTLFPRPLWSWVLYLPTLYQAGFQFPKHRSTRSLPQPAAIYNTAQRGFPTNKKQGKVNHSIPFPFPPPIHPRLLHISIYIHDPTPLLLSFTTTTPSQVSQGIVCQKRQVTLNQRHAPAPLLPHFASLA